MEEVLTLKEQERLDSRGATAASLDVVNSVPRVQRVRWASMTDLYSGFRMAQLGRKEAH